ncbi:hypothetical protein LCGC14_0429880 [marine sediment metagenome]|uniref:DUF3310 domain-containing protein n=1 Tax=marine sediment metagenome TaxID=412755 RepID=A0A0F9T6K6_9ZZZZ
MSANCPNCPEHPDQECIRNSVEIELHTTHIHLIGVGSHEYRIDIINHPPHYNEGNIEVIDFIEDKQLGFHLGNVVKYICRESKGNYLEDLEKAKWYLDREVARRKKEAAKTD